MENRLRRYACPGLAAVAIVVGTLATGVLPATPLYQLLAGALIVAGFALGYACLGVGRSNEAGD
jgi:hypothetical protein